MAELQLKGVGKRFDSVTAVENVDLTIPDGKLVCLLGPSGCGKTTLIRIVAGLEEPTTGRLLLDGEDITGLPAHRRNFGMVFQSLALFPHLTVAENIAYGLRIRGADRAAQNKRVSELLEMVQLPGLGDRHIAQLSGGQRQRVAIARALGLEPRLFLLDEPLSALDLKLRQHMRTELRAIQQRVGLTFIYITHDQGEALTMSDHIAVMREGVIEQVGGGKQIYDDPATAFVASFVGENNSFAGTVKSVNNGQALVSTATGDMPARIATAARDSLKPGDNAMIFIRPENFSFTDTGSGANHIAATVVNEEFEGQSYHVFMEGAGGAHMKMSQTNKGQARISSVGDNVTLVYDPEQAVALPSGALSDEE